MDRQVNMEEINRDSFSDYLRKRYPDREKCSDMHPGILEELIVYLHDKFNTIEQIEQALVRTERAFGLYEIDNPPSILVDQQYTAEGTVMLSMQLLYDDFADLKQRVVDVLDPDKLAEYKKHILPEEN